MLILHLFKTIHFCHLQLINKACKIFHFIFLTCISETHDLLVNCFVLLQFVSGLFLGPILVLANMDPYHSLELIFNIKLNYCVRLCLMHLLTLEFTRSCNIITFPILSIFKIYLSLLNEIRRLPSNWVAVRKYTRLQCINKCGDEAFRLIDGTLMIVGFVLCIIGLWIILQGWKFLPLLLYLMASLTVISGFIVVLVKIPSLVNVYKCSRYLIDVHWRRHNNANSRYMRRLFKAQRPICFYYGTAEYTNTTETVYYHNILDSTVSVMLLF